MPEQTKTDERTWTEAPASVNLKFNFRGFDTMLTLRGESGADVLPKLETAIEWLQGHGAAATVAGNGNGNGTQGGDSETKICAIHGAKMRRREKQGDIWYSHRAFDENGNEYWCRGEQD